MHFHLGRLSLFQEPTNRANGLTRDVQGRLIACEHDSRRVTRQELDGSITVVANSFQGRQLNRPNDVVVKSAPVIFFAYAHAREGKASKSASFARVAISLITLTH